MVRDVDDALDLGHRVTDRDLDPLLQRRRRHPTALAAARQHDVGDGLFDCDELRLPAVRGDGRVHLLVERRDDRAGDVTGEVRVGHVGLQRGDRGGFGTVRVLHDHAAPVKSSVAPARRSGSSPSG